MFGSIRHGIERQLPGSPFLAFECRNWFMLEGYNIHVIRQPIVQNMRCTILLDTASLIPSPLVRWIYSSYRHIFAIGSRNQTWLMYFYVKFYLVLWLGSSLLPPCSTCMLPLILLEGFFLLKLEISSVLFYLVLPFSHSYADFSCSSCFVAWNLVSQIVSDGDDVVHIRTIRFGNQ